MARLNANVRLDRATAGMAAILNQLALREQIGERSKDRALEYKKLDHALATLKQAGRVQESNQKLQLLSLKLDGQVQKKQLELEGAKLNLNTAVTQSNMKDASQRRTLAFAGHQLRRQQVEAQIKNMSDESARLRRQELTGESDRQMRMASLLDERALNKSNEAKSYATGLVEIFVKASPDGEGMVPNSTYQDMFDQLATAWNLDSYDAVMSEILNRYHSNYQEIAGGVLKKYGALTLLDENIPTQVREAVIGKVMNRVYSAAPDKLGQGAGIFYEAARVRMSGNDEANLRKSIKEAYPNLTPDDHEKLFQANLIDSVMDGGKIFTGKRIKNGILNATDGDAALDFVSQGAQVILNEKMTQMSPVYQALPGYSTARFEWGKSVDGAARANSEAVRLNALVGLEQEAVRRGNPSGLTGRQARHADLNLRTGLESFGTDLSFGNEGNLWMSKALSDDAIGSLADDAGVEKTDIPFGINPRPDAALPPGVAAPTGAQAAAPEAPIDYGYGLPAAGKQIGQFFGPTVEDWVGPKNEQFEQWQQDKYKAHDEWSKEQLGVPASMMGAGVAAKALGWMVGIDTAEMFKETLAKVRPTGYGMKPKETSDASKTP